MQTQSPITTLLKIKLESILNLLLFAVFSHLVPMCINYTDSLYKHINLYFNLLQFDLKIDPMLLRHIEIGCGIAAFWVRRDFLA